MSNPIKIASQRRRRSALQARGLTVRGTVPVRARHPELIGLSWRERNNRYVRALRAHRVAAGLTVRGTILKQRRPAFRGAFNGLPQRQRHAAYMRLWRAARRVHPPIPIPDSPISK